MSTKRIHTGRRLRVLHLIETFDRGGAEVLLANTLPALNHQLDVRVLALTPPAALVDEFHAGGVEATILDAPGRSIAHLTRRLRAAIHANPVDIVHTHLFTPTLVARLARLTLSKPPRLVTTLHNPDYSNPESASKGQATVRQLVDWLSGGISNDAFIAVSEAVAADYRRHMRGWAAWKRIHVIHNAIDVERFEANLNAVDRAAARQSWGWTPQQLAILSIGRLTRQKDYGTLIEAVALLRSRGVDASAIVIGEGPERAGLEARADGLVRFTGRTSHDRVVEALAACDVYVQPSRWEAFGIAILEAMTAARPVVASAVDGILEVVDDGQTGSLVPPGNARAIAEAIARLVDRPELRNQWGERGRVRAAAHFSVEQWVVKTVGFYSTVTECTATR